MLVSIPHVAWNAYGVEIQCEEERGKGKTGRKKSSRKVGKSKLWGTAVAVG